MAPSGSDFARQVTGMSEDEREVVIEREMLAGDIPSFLKLLAPVTLIGETTDGRNVRVTVCVAPDYLAIGSGSDFLYMPMRLATALRIAGRFGFTLPTPRIVDAIYEQAAVHLIPQPLPAGDQMRSTNYYQHHNELINRQRASISAHDGTLIAGHKKDIVLSNRLRRFPGRVAIYGWHRGDNDPIQTLSTLHGAHYADYSHGVRLISTLAYVDGVPRSIFDVLADPHLAPILSDEGPMPDLNSLTAELSTPAVDTSAIVPGSASPTTLVGALGGADARGR